MIKPISILLILLSLVLNASAVEPTWKHNVGSAIESTPVISEGIIYFGDNNGVFHAMSEGSIELWNVTLNGGIKGKASVSDNIYVSAGNTIYSISKNGSVNWNYSLSSSSSSATSPVYSNGLVFFGYIDKLYAININGIVQWTQNIGSAIVAGAPVIHNNNIYICNGDDLYVFSSTGSLKWTYSTGTKYRIYSSPLIDSDGIVYFGSGDNSVYAVYPNGTLKWKYDTSAPIEYSNTAISPDRSVLYVGSLDGYLHAVYNNIIDMPVTHTYTNNTDAYLSVASSTYLDLRFMKSINMDTSLNGSIKITYSMRSDEQDPYVHAHVRVYKNSSGIKTQVGDEYATSTYYAWETFTITSDVNMTPGDTVEVWAWHDVSSNRTQWARIGNLTVTCTDIPIRANGTSYWKYWVGYNIQSSPLVDKGIIYFGGDDNKIYAVYTNGTPAWQYTTGGRVRSSASSDNGIFIGSDDGNLYAFGAYTEVGMFRNACMSGNNVICSQTILNSYGENGTLKNIWTQLTIPEKRNIGIELYKYLNTNVFYTVYLNTVCTDPGCNDTKSAWCLGNSIIRLMRFITPEEGKTFSNCYYKNGHGETLSYYYEKSYGLVAYPVDVASVQNNFYHSISALQIGDNITRFDNWLFFQYGDSNIVPGSWNMPLPVKVTIRHYFEGECLGYGDYGSPVAVWDFNAPEITPTAAPPQMPTPEPTETPVVTPTPTPTFTPTPTPTTTPAASPTPVITSSGGSSGSSSSGSSSSGSSGGGGGGSPSEPYKNVNKSYKIEKYIYHSIPAVYDFSKAGMLIYEIDIASDVNIPETEIKIEELKNTSSLTNATPLKGASYYNVWINTKRFKNATIKFNCNNVATLLEWSNITWQDMNIEKNNGSCQVITDTLSTTFAISQTSKPGDFKYRPISPPSKDIVVDHNIDKKEVRSNPFENIINFFKSFLEAIR